jgi:hypothetical protein
MKKLILYAFLVLPTFLSGQGLFGTDSILQITISGDIKGLMNDRADIPSDHPMTLTYVDTAGLHVKMNITTRTRGNFRRKLGGCTYPPVMLVFQDKNSIENTLFSEQRKLKLVMPCRGDEYVVKEYMGYKIYNLLTPMSFKTRLVRITLEDTKRSKLTPPFYGILLEEEHQLAKRNNMVSVERKMGSREAEPVSFHRMAVFEYLIANTDWSVEYLQNVKLLAKDSVGIAFTVPYDFDHAGLVSAPYAKPAEELQMSSVRERRYRGYCLTDMTRLDPIFKEFNAIKDQINSLYESASYLDAGSKKTALKFIDDFYAVIKDPQKLKRDFGYPCDKSGTGNIIIGGLKSSNE